MPRTIRKTGDDGGFTGFATWVWRQGDLVCFLVSDMVGADQAERFKEYFVRVRTATDPFLAY